MPEGASECHALSAAQAKAAESAFLLMQLVAVVEAELLEPVLDFLAAAEAVAVVLRHEAVLVDSQLEGVSPGVVGVHDQLCNGLGDGAGLREHQVVDHVRRHFELAAFCSAHR
ncbi:hypothetical protein D3C78_1290300 [compost metagenome]